MDSGSLVQPGRDFTSVETAEELEGFLEIPDRPEITAGYADIYHGFWTNSRGERVEVAIKELRTLVPKDRLTGQDELQRKADTRLKREVFVWSQISHPNLHPLLGYRSQPQPRLISPWCRHGNLKDYLRANRGLSRCDKLRLIYQTVCGLEYLHSRNPPICHADIKPENVLINNWLGATLSDFGMSRVLQDLGLASGFTTSETVKGTLSYMAGELFIGQKPNLESDIYAFGGLILTVMSGKAPFYGLPHQVVLRSVVLNQLPTPKDHPNLPADDPLWKLMRRCWDKTPASRPTMREVLLELLEQILLEEANPRPNSGLVSVANDTSSERPDTDHDTLGPPQQGSSFCRLNPNPVHVGYSLPSLPEMQETLDSTPEKVLMEIEGIFKGVEVKSKVVPVIGGYIEAAIEVGLTVLEIVRVESDASFNRFYY